MEIGGKTYQIGKMPVKTQYHVMRRILPAAMALPELLGALDRFKDKADATGFVASVVPFAKALSSMSDQDSEFVIDACLRVCKREENGRPFPLTAANGSLMYQDLTLAGIIALTVEVLRENLSSFFPEVMALVTGATPETSSTSP